MLAAGFPYEHAPRRVKPLCRWPPATAMRADVGSGAYVWPVMNSRTKATRSSIEAWGTRTRV
jgi:hypothetical protein